MYWMKHQSRQENSIYLVVWGLLFAAPLLSAYLRTVNDPYIDFSWHEVFFAWHLFGLFLGLFLVHNFLLAPLLIHQHRRALYFSIATLLIAGFVVLQCTTRPQRHDFRRPPMAQQHRPPHMDEPPMMDEHRMDEHRMDEHRMDGHRMDRRHRAPMMASERDIMSVVMVLLMFGANLGAKLYFRSRADQHKLQLLEKQNLEQQLEYLKYQINPHFFMNTLNNIHALVDIDPQKAQDTILELSRMMRFVLYEGDKHGVPLGKELAFIQHYTRLMQLRYTDKVQVTVDVPTETPDKQIPPLMLITFIENAFKHGISYQHPSFVDIKVAVDDKQLHFSCRNSKAEQPQGKKGGVGLVNVKKRLDLLYDRRYTLDIKDEPDIYTVELTIPL